MQSQEELKKRVEMENPSRCSYVKDQPILGWRLDADSVDDLPPVIRDNLGAADASDYTPSYVRRNRGSVVALQMTEDGPDFYIIGKSTYDERYREVPLAEVEAKNTRLMEQLSKLPELEMMFRRRDPNLVGALKAEPVDMIEMSDIGYDTGEEVTIASPWGTQTKPAGRDAFLVHDASKDEYYMINADRDGRPISYVPAA